MYNDIYEHHLSPTDHMVMYGDICNHHVSPSDHMVMYGDIYDHHLSPTDHMVMYGDIYDYHWSQPDHMVVYIDIYDHITPGNQQRLDGEERLDGEWQRHIWLDGEKWATVVGEKGWIIMIDEFMYRLYSSKINTNI